MLTIKMTAIDKRRDMADALRKSLGLRDSDIFWDDRPEEERGDAMYTVRKAWLSPQESGETHRLVISEDLDVCENFRQICEEMIKAHPDACFSPFTTVLNDPYYDEFCNGLKTPYVAHQIGIFGCAILLPSHLIKEAFDWIDSNLPPDVMDNTAMNAWLRHKGLQVLTTVPCTIQHIGDISIVDPAWPVRRSTRFDLHATADWSNTEVAGFPELEWFKPYEWAVFRPKKGEKR